MKLEIGAGMLIVCEEFGIRRAIRSLEPGQSREVSRLLSLALGLRAGENLVSREEEGLVTPGVSIPTEPEPGPAVTSCSVEPAGWALQCSTGCSGGI